MAKTWARAPSPCIGVCKFHDEHCIGCSMTKRERKAFKRLRKKSRKRELFETLVARLHAVARLDYWARMYRRKCDRKEADCPLDKLAFAPSADPEHGV